MIKRKTKFTNPIEFNEFELGDKNRLMQHLTGQKGRSIHAPSEIKHTVNGTEEPILTGRKGKPAEQLSDIISATNIVSQTVAGVVPVHQEEVNDFTGDAKILFEAYTEFSKAGMTSDKKAELSQIDAVLKDASIQLKKDGSAIITDVNGKSTKVGFSK